MIKRILFLIITFVCVPEALFASAAGDVRTGNRFYDKQLYDESIGRYRAAQMQAPNSAEIHFNTGDALHRQQKFDEATTEYNRALTSKNRILRGMSYYNLGNNAYRQEKTDEALEYYKKALDMNPRDMDAKYNMEYILYRDKSKTKNDKNKKDSSKKGKDKDKAQQQQQGGQKEKEEQQKKQEAGKNKTGMSKEDAQRILQYYNDEEKNNAQKRKMTMPQIPKVEEDW